MSYQNAVTSSSSAPLDAIFRPTDAPSAAASAALLIASLISHGEFSTGSRLGSERELAERFGISRSVLRSGLRLLEESGTITRSRGRNGGSYVSDKRIERDLSALIGLPNVLKSQGFIAGTRIIKTTIREALGLEASALSLAMGEMVIELIRIRLANGSPISLECTVLPANRFPGLLEKSLGGSLYDLIESEYGIKANEASERIEIKLSDADEAKVLGVDVGAPLFLVTRTTLDPESIPFEYAIDLFRSDRTLIYIKTFGPSGTQVSTVGSDLTEAVPENV